MEKTGQVKLGSTPCDYCNKPATCARGRLVLCASHAEEHDSTIKSASVESLPLKAAPIVLSDSHKK